MESERQNIFIKQAAIAGGGDYCGIHRGSRQIQTPDLILFNHPTGTTSACAAGAEGITAQQVQSKDQMLLSGICERPRADISVEDCS